MNKKITIEKLKMLVDLSKNIEEADELIETYIGLIPTNEKIIFLLNNWDVELIDGDDNSEEALKDNYKSMLSAIINKKFF